MIKKLIRAILSWIDRKTELWKTRRMWAKAPHAKVKSVSIKELQKEYRVPVSFQKPKWTYAEKGLPNAPGRYIVKHKGRLREAILKTFSLFPKIVLDINSMTDKNTGESLRSIEARDGKTGFVIDHRDTVPMKGVTAWYPAPENLIKIW